MPTLHIAGEYQSFGLEDIQRTLESCGTKDSKDKAQKIFEELKDFASYEKKSRIFNVPLTKHFKSEKLCRHDTN